MTHALETLIRRDRAIVVGGIMLTTGVALAHVLTGAGTGMSVSAMTTTAFPLPRAPSGGPGWTTGYALQMLLMWWAMMVAMMTPAAAPVVLLYARVVRSAQARGQIAPGPAPVGGFVLGYLATWLGFSVAATGGQWALEAAGLLSGAMMWSTSPVLSAALLAAAGLYQLSPWKDACLVACRSPIGYLTASFRPGRMGAVRMGIGHGAVCVGCCWLAMTLFFVGGAMNLVWMAGLAVLVLAEKALPNGRLVARLAGAGMLALAALLLSA